MKHEKVPNIYRRKTYVLQKPDTVILKNEIEKR